MSIISRIPRSDLGTKYTHYGLFCGLLPVYIDDPESEAPEVVERNGWPAWTLSLCAGLHGSFIWFASLISPGQVFDWPLVITGRIKPPVR